MNGIYSSRVYTTSPCNHLTNRGIHFNGTLIFWYPQNTIQHTVFWKTSIPLHIAQHLLKNVFLWAISSSLRTNESLKELRIQGEFFLLQPKKQIEKVDFKNAYLMDQWIQFIINAENDYLEPRYTSLWLYSITVDCCYW